MSSVTTGSQILTSNVGNAQLVGLNNAKSVWGINEPDIAIVSGSSVSDTFNDVIDLIDLILERVQTFDSQYNQNATFIENGQYQVKIFHDNYNYLSKSDIQSGTPMQATDHNALFDNSTGAVVGVTTNPSGPVPLCSEHYTTNYQSGSNYENSSSHYLQNYPAHYNNGAGHYTSGANYGSRSDHYYAGYYTSSGMHYSAHYNNGAGNYTSHYQPNYTSGNYGTRTDHYTIDYYQDNYATRSDHYYTYYTNSSNYAARTDHYYSGDYNNGAGNYTSHYQPNYTSGDYGSRTDHYYTNYTSHYQPNYTSGDYGSRSDHYYSHYTNCHSYIPSSYSCHYYLPSDYGVGTYYSS